ALEQRLSEDYQGATAEVLSQLQARAADLSETARNLGLELAARRHELDSLKVGQAKTHELRSRRHELQSLNDRRRGIEAQEGRLDAAKRALPVMAAIRAAEDAERDASKQTERLVESEARLDEARSSYDGA